MYLGLMSNYGGHECQKSTSVHIWLPPLSMAAVRV